MNKVLTVLLVEDDIDACKELSEYIDNVDDISLVATTNNSDEAVKAVKDYLPHAVILDLELHCGGGNGLLFLQQLKDLDVQTYVLITTNNSSTVTYDYARKLGADFIMSKHQADYSAKGVVDFLRMMKEIIISRTGASSPEHTTTETPEQKSKRMNKRVCAELDLVGISPKAVGYKYLIDAIRLIMDKPEHNICAIIGQKYGKTDASVERAMQNAINRAWRTADIDDLTRYYTARISSERGVPTLTELIYYYANKIKNEY